VIKRIDMTQNQFLCDCDIHTFVTWIQTNAKKEDDKLNSSTQVHNCDKLRNTINIVCFALVELMCIIQFSPNCRG